MSEPHHHDHDDGHHHGSAGPWWRDVISNWTTYDAPFSTKVRLASRNLLRRARLKPCCGHPGEPGC